MNRPYSEATVELVADAVAEATLSPAIGGTRRHARLVLDALAAAGLLLPEGAETRTDMLDHYSRALDEIFRLRRALAYEARAVEGVLNGYASLPRTARPKLAAQVERMREAARGEAGVAYADVAPWAWKGVLRQAGADVTLSRSQWESGDAVRLAVGDSKPTGQDPSVSVEETPQ